MNPMEEDWNRLAELLREEIGGYGNLFHLLEKQRDSLLQRDIDALWSSIEGINDLSSELHNLKREREAFVRRMGEEAALPDVPTVRGLLDHFAPESKPMLSGLVEEVNRLVQKSKHHLQRNHMLLRRSQEIGRNFLHVLNPESARGSLYRRNGSAATAGEADLFSRYVQKA